MSTEGRSLVAPGRGSEGRSAHQAQFAAVPQPTPRPRWRELVAGGLYHSGALRLAQQVSRSWEVRSNGSRSLPRLHRVTSPRFAILCYHRIGTAGVPLYSTLPPAVFEAQMRFLRKHYRIVSLAELCRELESPSSLDPAVAITFDDGYRDLYAQAFPILRKYEIPATIFLVAGAVETGQTLWYDRVFLALQAFPGDILELELDRPTRFLLGSRANRIAVAQEIVRRLRLLPDARRRECCAALEKRVTVPEQELAGHMLTWEQIHEMNWAGITWGSHSVTHSVLGQLSPTEVEWELRESKQILETRLGCAVEDFAFPFGQPRDCGVVAAATLARCGYRSAVTTVPGINTAGANLYALHRVQIGEERHLATFAFQLNQLFFCPGHADSAIDPGSSSAEQHEQAHCGSGLSLSVR